MSYISDSLATNERLIYRAQFHWAQKVGPYLAFIACCAAAVASLWLGSGPAALFGAIALVGLGVIVLGTLMLPIWTTEIGVTNQRFIFKRGWLHRTTDELQLTSIEEVNLQQSLLGRLLDYGSLILHGTGVNDISLPPLSDPVGLRRAVQEGMGAAKATVVVQPSNGSPQSTAA